MKTNQQDLFEAKQARDEALKRVENNSGDWLGKALREIGLLPGGREMIGEDIRIAIHEKVGAPHHHNAWGAVIKSAVSRKLLIPTDKYRHMKTKKSHARASRVYLVNKI